MDHRPATRKVIAWTTWWLASMAFYLLLAAKVARAEIVVGAVLAAIAATAAFATQATAGLRYRPAIRWLGRLGPLGLRTLADCGIVAMAICRRLARRERPPGRFRHVAINAGGDDPLSAMRRAMLVEAVSISPNTFVVALDAGKGNMLVHQLVPSEEPLPGEKRS